MNLNIKTLCIILLFLLLVSIGYAKGKTMQFWQTIWCLHKDLYFWTPKSWWDDGCWIGKNWGGIKFPKETLFNKIKSIYKWDKEKMASMMAIINWESGFNENARWPNKWGVDCGLFQIRDINGGCKMTVDQQMQWAKKKMENDYKNKCKSWKQGSPERTRCMFSRYNWQTKTWNYYSQRMMKVRQFYLDYFLTY